MQCATRFLGLNIAALGSCRKSTVLLFCGPASARSVDLGISEAIVSRSIKLAFGKRLVMCAAIIVANSEVVRSGIRRLVSGSRLVERDWAIRDVNCRITGEAEVTELLPACRLLAANSVNHTLKKS